LLEILVATAILATAVAALLGLLSGSLGNLQRLQAPAQALLLGESRMNELLLATPATAGPGGAESTLALDGKIQGQWDEQFRWEATATRFAPSQPATPGQTILVRIALDVFWRPAPGKPEKKLSLETYQLRPEPPTQGQ